MPEMSDVTLGEIDRRLRDMREDVSDKLADLASEIRSLRTELVRRDVYDANRITDQQRIFAAETAIEDFKKERTAMRRLVYSAAFSAIIGMIVAIWTYFLNHH